MNVWLRCDLYDRFQSLVLFRLTIQHGRCFSNIFPIFNRFFVISSIYQMKRFRWKLCGNISMDWLNVKFFKLWMPFDWNKCDFCVSQLVCVWHGSAFTITQLNVWKTVAKCVKVSIETTLCYQFFLIKWWIISFWFPNRVAFVRRLSKRPQRSSSRNIILDWPWTSIQTNVFARRLLSSQPNRFATKLLGKLSTFFTCFYFVYSTRNLRPQFINRNGLVSLNVRQ